MKLSAIILIICITSFSFATGYYYSQSTILAHKNPTVKANVFFVYERMGADAEVAEGNVITNIGENVTLEAIVYGWSGNLTKLAVGNVTGTLQTKTVLDTVYNDPTDPEYPEGTLSDLWMNSGDISINVTYQWTFEETVNLDAAASYLGNTTYAFAMANFGGGAQTFNNNENLTVRWSYTFDAND